MTRTRLGALCLAMAAVMFVLYPAVRPWTDESTVDGSVAAMSSGAWVASHAFAMLGFILVSLGLLSLSAAVRQTPGARMASAAVVTSWVGAGLTLVYYGAEDFGLHAIASTVPAGEVLALVAAVRYNPVAITMFGVGLVTLAVSGVLAAIAVARSGRLSRWSGTVFAAGYVLFLPQFFGSAAVRIGHGVVLGLGLLWLAVSLGRRPE
jgi:uncharacterized membrane protein